MEAKLKLVKSIVGTEIPEALITKTLSECNQNADAAVNLILDSSPPLTVHKTVNSTGGSRISIASQNGVTKVKDEVKDESDNKAFLGRGRSGLSFEDWLALEEKAEAKVKQESQTEVEMPIVRVKEEVIEVEPLNSRKLSGDEYRGLQSQMSSNKRPKIDDRQEMTLSTVLIEDGEFKQEPDWLLVGRTVITGISTTKGRKLENNEIVHFAFPQNAVRATNTRFVTAKAASSIVRFSTKRSGEV